MQNGDILEVPVMFPLMFGMSSTHVMSSLQSLKPAGMERLITVGMRLKR